MFSFNFHNFKASQQAFMKSQVKLSFFNISILILYLAGEWKKQLEVIYVYVI